MGSQSSVPRDLNGVFWLAQTWLTLFAFVALIKMLSCLPLQLMEAWHRPYQIIVNPFSLLCSIFFLSRKPCFLRSPCLLLIAESISLDTSGKPTVGFFLKIASSSWIILSIPLDELNSSDWLLKSWWWIFLK